MTEEEAKIELFKNAAFLHGISGNAGVFSTGEDIAKLCMVAFFHAELSFKTFLSGLVEFKAPLRNTVTKECDRYRISTFYVIFLCNDFL